MEGNMPPDINQKDNASLQELHDLVVWEKKEIKKKS